MDITFMTPAFSATSGARNAASRSRNERTTTPPMNSGSRSAVTSDWSARAAVVPPIRASSPLAGTTSSRSRSRRSVVAVALGRGGRDDRHDRGVAGGVVARGLDRRDALLTLQPLGERADRRAVLAVLHVG